MVDVSQQSPTGFLPFGSTQGAIPQSGVSPQGFDIGQFAQQLAGQAAQALPGLIMGLLSASPQLRAQSAGPQGVSPQSSIGFQGPFGISGGISLPFGAAPQVGVSPQGFDFGQFAQQLAGQAAQALPGLIMGLLSASPQLRAQSAGPQGVSPQGFDFGQFAQQLAGQASQMLPGLIMSVLSAQPTLGQNRPGGAGSQMIH